MLAALLTEENHNIKASQAESFPAPPPGIPIPRRGVTQSFYLAPISLLCVHCEGSREQRNSTGLPCQQSLDNCTLPVLSAPHCPLHAVFNACKSFDCGLYYVFTNQFHNFTTLSANLKDLNHLKPPVVYSAVSNKIKGLKTNVTIKRSTASQPH